MQASPSCLMWWQAWDQSLEISVTASHNEHLSAAVCLSCQPTRGTEIFTFNDNNSLYLMIVNRGFFLIFMWYSVLLKKLIWLYFNECIMMYLLSLDILTWLWLYVEWSHLDIDLVIGVFFSSVVSQSQACMCREGDCLGEVYMLEASKSEILYLLCWRKLLITDTAVGWLAGLITVNSPAVTVVVRRESGRI